MFMVVHNAWIGYIFALHTSDYRSTETQTDSDGDIILYYQSVRGPVLASMVVGMVREVARSFFSTAVTFERILTQGVDG